MAGHGCSVIAGGPPAGRRSEDSLLERWRFQTLRRDWGLRELGAFLRPRNAARRLMQQNGLGQNQVATVRGYADQKLRKPDDPLDPSNRRISLIVQNIVKDDAESENVEKAKPLESVPPAH